MSRSSGTCEPRSRLELLKLQNAEAAGRHKHGVDEDCTVVYIPPYFKHRIVAFIMAVCAVCCLAIAATLAGLVLLGRRFFLLYTAREAHDGYSFAIGFYLEVFGSLSRRSSAFIVTDSAGRMDLGPGSRSSLPNIAQCGSLKLAHGVLPGLRYSGPDSIGDGDVRVLTDQVHL